MVDWHYARQRQLRDICEKITANTGADADMIEGRDGETTVVVKRYGCKNGILLRQYRLPPPGMEIVVSVEASTIIVDFLGQCLDDAMGCSG